MDLSVHEHGQCQVFRKGHDKCFAKVIKYLKHVYQRAFARGAEEGGKAFTETIKYLRHILEGFCKEGDGEGGRRVLEDFCRDHKISQTPMGGLLQGS